MRGRIPRSHNLSRLCTAALAWVFHRHWRRPDCRPADERSPARLILCVRPFCFGRLKPDRAEPPRPQKAPQRSWRFLNFPTTRSTASRRAWPPHPQKKVPAASTPTTRRQSAAAALKQRRCRPSRYPSDCRERRRCVPGWNVVGGGVECIRRFQASFRKGTRRAWQCRAR